MGYNIIYPVNHLFLSCSEIISFVYKNMSPYLLLISYSLSIHLNMNCLIVHLPRNEVLSLSISGHLILNQCIINFFLQSSR